jgi:hypothetical protein
MAVDDQVIQQVLSDPLLGGEPDKFFPDRIKDFKPFILAFPYPKVERR